MKAKKMLITILILCFIVTGCTACSSGSVDDAASSEKTEEQDNAVNKTENINMAPSEGELGNPNTNLVDDGLVAKKDSWIYFEFEGDLYKSKEDTSERQKLYDVDDGEYVAKINVIGDWVYFLQFSLNGGGIYKIKTDGTENQQICSESVEHLYIIDEWLYYKIHNDATIYRMKTDGSEQQIFCASDDVDIDNKNTEVESIQEVVSNQPINLSNTYKIIWFQLQSFSLVIRITGGLQLR